MTWAVLALIGLGLMLTYIIWQETRSHLHWRSLVTEGDVWAIRQLVTEEIQHWRRMRPPAGVPVALWASVQTVEIVAIAGDHVQVACSAEGEYRMAGGRREQVVSALDAGMRLACKLVEMLLYDIPEVKVGRVRVDVYSSFRSVSGEPDQRCILSTTADRETANSIDWDGLQPRAIIDRLESRYCLDSGGTAREIDPGPPLQDVVAEQPNAGQAGPERLPRDEERS